MKLEKLQTEMVAAMKNKDKVRKDTISSMIQAIKKYGIDNLCKDNMTDEQIDTVILKEKKTMQEMIDTCPVDRVELMAEYQTKIKIIDEFAPTLMTNENEIITYLNSISIELIKANRGEIMKSLKGKADMKIANKVVSNLLK